MLLEVVVVDVVGCCWMCCDGFRDAASCFLVFVPTKIFVPLFLPVFPKSFQNKVWLSVRQLR